MKELSIEEKAKAYDEAIAVINKSETDKYGCLIGIKPSDIFPELKESEDEKIRKAISYVLNNADYSLIDNTDFTVSEMESWLEEKAGQKGDKGNEKETPNSEQKLHEWSEIEDIAVHLENLGNTAMANTLRSFRPQANHEWSKEDEKMLDLFLHKLEVCTLLTNKENHWILDKFKSMKERVQPQKQWKPTKAMLEALKWAKSEFHPDCTDTMNNLNYLYKEIEQMYYDRT